MIIKKFKDHTDGIRNLEDEFTIKLFKNNFAYEYISRLEDYEKELLNCSWDELNEGDKQDIITNYIPAKLNEAIIKFNKYGITFDIKDIINISKQIQPADKEYKRAFKTILYYLSFAEIINEGILKECLNNIKSGSVNLKFRLTVPLNYHVVCPSCNKNHYIDFLNQSLNITGTCSNCSHYIYKPSKLSITPGNSFDFYTYNCSCDKCKSKREKLNKDLEIIKNRWVTESTTELYQLAQEINNENKIDVKTITEKQLKNYYLINKNNLDKTTREILSMKPESYEEVLEIVDQMVESKFYNNKEQILKNLIDTKVIYKEPFIGNETSISLDEFNTFVNDAVEYVTKDFARQLVFILFEFAKSEIIIGNATSITKNLKKIYKTQDEIRYVLNPYFLQNTNAEQLNISEYNVLKSNAEMCVLSDLMSRYPDYLVLPNYPLNQMLNINNFKDFFEKSELRYLKYCVYDFVIIDKDGYVAKVVECQKGKHHNDKEWIKKDYLKRKILELSKIDFEEVF